MAALTPSLTAIVSPSLLESLTVHPPSHFSLGMETFTDSYLKSMEANFPAEDVDKLRAQQTTDSISLCLPIYPEHMHFKRPPPTRDRATTQEAENASRC